MSRILNSVKSGITRALGKTSTALTVPTPLGSIESDPPEALLPSFDIKLGFINSKEFEESLIRLKESFDRLTATTYGTLTRNGCRECTHDMEHHNRDKRMSSGYGMCICRGCKKYVSPYSYIVPAATTYVSRVYIPTVSSSANLTNFTIDYAGFTASHRPTMKLEVTVSPTSLRPYSGDTEDFLKTLIGGDPNKISIKSWQNYYNVNGNVTVRIFYEEI